MTSPDDRQPGGSEQLPKPCPDIPGHMGWLNCPTHSAEIRAKFGLRLQEPSGSGAGSTVEGIHVIARRAAWDEWARNAGATGDPVKMRAYFAGWNAATDELRAALEEVTRQRDGLLVLIKGYRDEFHNNVIDINKSVRRLGLNDD